MKRISKITLTSLAVVLMALAPACHKKKDVTPAVVPTESVAPVVEDVRPDTTTVAPEKDFVPDTPVAETFPEDMDKMNEYARQKGYIKDAFYNYDESTLDADAQAALSTSATWLKGKDGAGYKLLVEGHCDERGTEQYNLALGDRRANSAKDYLATLGVDASRVRTVSYGEEKPFAEGHDDTAFAQNRRAHLVLVRQ